MVVLVTLEVLVLREIKEELVHKDQLDSLVIVVQKETKDFVVYLVRKVTEEIEDMMVKKEKLVHWANVDHSVYKDQMDWKDLKDPK